RLRARAGGAAHLRGPRPVAAGVANAKKPRTPIGSVASAMPSGGGVDPLRHGRLAVGGLVLVDHALAGRLVEGARGGALQLNGLLGVARLDGLAELPHRSADLRAHGLVALAPLF